MTKISSPDRFKISVETKNLLGARADLLVVNLHDGKINKASFLDKIDKQLRGEIAKLLKKESFKGLAGTSKLIYTGGRLKAHYVLILGLGDEAKFTLETARRCGATLRGMAEQIKAARVVSAAHGGHLKGMDKGACAQAVVEGFLLSAYKFTNYTKPAEYAVKELALLCPDRTKLASVKKGVTRARTLARGVWLARDLINTPAADMTPLALAAVARKCRGVRTRIHNLSAIKRLKMGAFLGVARASTANPPAFIEMHYRPRGKARKKIAIVGKGVTFDSGGLSIKSAKSMETMKDDMSGAAAAIGLMAIIRALAPKVAVSSYVAATENVIDGFAIRPGDIVRAMNGKTIEVLNTDAEGRLTLADAMTYAQRYKPDVLIDMATLTGACLVALGMNYSAIMGNDQKLIDDLIEAGKTTGEKLWQLPLVEEYKDQIKSPIADFKNIGGAYAGTITAGLFLENFAGKTQWVHIDIAGPAWSDSPQPLGPQGGTGVMIRTLARFLAQQ